MKIKFFFKMVCLIFIAFLFTGCNQGEGKVIDKFLYPMDLKTEMGSIGESVLTILTYNFNTHKGTLQLIEKPSGKVIISGSFEITKTMSTWALKDKRGGIHTIDADKKLKWVASPGNYEDGTSGYAGGTYYFTIPEYMLL